MIQTNTISLNYIKKEPLTGSFQGMRYRLAKVSDEMEVCFWPQPYNYSKTASKDKTVKVFALTSEGKEEAVIWLNEQYLEQKSRWEQAMHSHL